MCNIENEITSDAVTKAQDEWIARHEFLHRHLAPRPTLLVMESELARLMAGLLK